MIYLFYIVFLSLSCVQGLHNLYYIAMSVALCLCSLDFLNSFAALWDDDHKVKFKNRILRDVGHLDVYISLFFYMAFSSAMVVKGYVVLGCYLFLVKSFHQFHLLEVLKKENEDDDSQETG